MCEIIAFKNKELATIADLIKELHIKEFRLNEGYKFLSLDACLCQIDIKKTLINSGIGFVTDNVNYRIV